MTGTAAGTLPTPVAAARTSRTAVFDVPELAVIPPEKVEPGPTTTEFQEMAGETAHAGEPPSNVVRIALESLGRQPSVISGWMNYVRGNVARIFPRSITALVAGRVMAQWTPADRQ